ncbi:MAG: hypothetical protein AAF658_06380 [Myxococcota bacterium]
MLAVAITTWILSPIPSCSEVAAPLVVLNRSLDEEAAALVVQHLSVELGERACLIDAPGLPDQARWYVTLAQASDADALQLRVIDLATQRAKVVEFAETDDATLVGLALVNAELIRSLSGESESPDAAEPAPEAPIASCPALCTPPDAVSHESVARVTASSGVAPAWTGRWEYAAMTQVRRFGRSDVGIGGVVSAFWGGEVLTIGLGGGGFAGTGTTTAQGTISTSSAIVSPSLRVGLVEHFGVEASALARTEFSLTWIDGEAVPGIDATDGRVWTSAAWLGLMLQASGGSVEPFVQIDVGRALREVDIRFENEVVSSLGGWSWAIGIGVGCCG